MNKKVIFKIVDVIAIIAVSIMIFDIFTNCLDHVAIIKNLPMDIDPIEKENLYQSLMR